MLFCRVAASPPGRNATPLSVSHHAFTLIPRKIISQAITMATIIITNSDQCGRLVRMIPVIIGFAAAPSQPSACAEK
jgi:hypothetical protein